MKIQQEIVPNGTSNRTVLCTIDCASQSEVAEALAYVVKLKLDALAAHASSFTVSEKLRQNGAMRYAFGYCDKVTRSKQLYVITISYPKEDMQHDIKSIETSRNSGKCESK